MKRINHWHTLLCFFATVWLLSVFTSVAAQDPSGSANRPPPMVVEGHCYDYQGVNGAYVVVRKEVVPPPPDRFHAEIADVYFVFRGDRPFFVNGKSAIFSARFYVEVPKVGESFPGKMTLVKGDCPAFTPSLRINGHTVLPNNRPVQFEVDH